MHVFRYDTQIKPDGSALWRFAVHSREGSIWCVAVTQDGAGYRWMLEGDAPSRYAPVQARYTSREQALRAATAYLGGGHSHFQGTRAG